MRPQKTYVCLLVLPIVRDWILLFTMHGPKLKTSDESLNIMLKIACSCHSYQDISFKIQTNSLNLLIPHLFHLKRSRKQLSGKLFFIDR